MPLITRKLRLLLCLSFCLVQTAIWSQKTTTNAKISDHQWLVRHLERNLIKQSFHYSGNQFHLIGVQIENGMIKEIRPFDKDTSGMYPYLKAAILSTKGMWHAEQLAYNVLIPFILLTVNCEEPLQIKQWQLENMFYESKHPTVLSRPVSILDGYEKMQRSGH